MPCVCRLEKDKAVSLTELSKLLTLRCEIDTLSCTVEPKGANQLQAQYMSISESIGLHRKARSTLNKDRVCTAYM